VSSIEPIPPWVSPDARLILERLEARMAVTQEQLNAYATAVASYAQAVNASVAGIAADIRAIKDANPNLDASALEANVARLGTATQGLMDLDAEHPPAEPPPPPPPSP
jgi:phage-related minor tail protein